MAAVRFGNSVGLLCLCFLFKGKKPCSHLLNVNRQKLFKKLVFFLAMSLNKSIFVIIKCTKNLRFGGLARTFAILKCVLVYVCKLHTVIEARLCFIETIN